MLKHRFLHDPKKGMPAPLTKSISTTLSPPLNTIPVTNHEKNSRLAMA
jgi:hypothetical protein